MPASQSTMDKLYSMRLSVMAQAYRDLEEMPGAADMTFDERVAMIVDAEWDARRVNKRAAAPAGGLPRARGERRRRPLRPRPQAGQGEDCGTLELRMDTQPQERSADRGVGRGQKLDRERARGRRMQRLLLRAVRAAPRDARRADGGERRGMVQDKEAIPRVRPAHLGRLAFGKGQREGRARAPRDRRGQAAHRFPADMLAVLASRLACQARRGRNSRCGY